MVCRPAAWFKRIMLVLQGLSDGVRAACAGLPDKRRGGEVTCSMEDIGLSAFSLFFMQSASFLSCQRGLHDGRKASNCQSLFGMRAIPTDNHVCTMLDPVHPSHLPAFDAAVDGLRRHGSLAPFQRLGRRVLIAFDGTEYFYSQRIGCPQRRMRQRPNGRMERCHSMLAATLVAATLVAATLVAATRRRCR